MAIFVKHIPCYKCGSKDNRAVYSDGGEYCFGCQDFTRGKITKEEPPQKEVKNIMDSVTSDIPEPNLSWLRKYLTDDQIDEFFYWSPQLNRHIYAEWFDDNRVAFWEARKVFKPEEDQTGISKNISSGQKPYSIRGKYKETGTLVIVEDIVSAIKLMDIVGVMCLHGSSLPWPVFSRIGNIPLIKKVIIWMDVDKYREATNFAKRFEVWGKDVSVIRTPEDPKDYSVEDIQEILKGAI